MFRTLLYLSFRDARIIITVYGFLHLMCWLDSTQDTSQHMKCRKPYAVINGLELLKMGIMMPETC